MQNPGKFMFPLSELRKQIHSMPRNPILSKLFRFARLSENAGYGIDKMLMWEQKRGKVDFTDDVVSSTIIFYFERDDIRFSINDTQGDTQGDTTEKSSQKSSQKSTQKGSEKPIIEPIAESIVESIVENLSAMRAKIVWILWKNPNATAQSVSKEVGIAPRNVQEHFRKLQTMGIIRRNGGDFGGHWEIITDR